MPENGDKRIKEHTRERNYSYTDIWLCDVDYLVSDDNFEMYWFIFWF